MFKIMAFSYLTKIKTPSILVLIFVESPQGLKNDRSLYQINIFYIEKSAKFAPYILKTHSNSYSFVNVCLLSKQMGLSLWNFLSCNSIPFLYQNVSKRIYSC